MQASEDSLIIQAPVSRAMQLARYAWPILGVLTVAILIASIPGYLFSPMLGVFEGHLILEAGTPAYVLTQATLAASFLSAVGSISLAVFLFLKKRTDPMGLFLSYYLLGHGLLFAGPIELLYPYWEAAPWVNSFILLPLFAGPMTVALVALFPDGQFVPPWSRWLILGSLISVPISLLSGSNLSPIELSVSPQLNTILVIGLVVGSVILLVASIYIQVFRYRKVSTAEQKLQTKWVLYGIGLWIILNSITSVGWTVALGLPANTPVPVWLPLASLVWVSSSLILPLSLTISITRFRLFEIDLIINRTLVYAALTAGVIAIYVLVVAVAGILFQTQGNLFIALLATGVVAVIFHPLRVWLQGSVNKLVFGEREDPYKVLSRLGSRLESALAPEMVLPTLVETIAQSLKLPYVAIHLPEGDGDRTAAAHGVPSPDLVRFPLTYQGGNIGQLVVAPRGDGQNFSSSELDLLQNIARQAGNAVRTVQLADDLRRSRQQIVTAREEERRRLRRDLHDGIGPSMAGQTLKLDAALDLIAEASENGRHSELNEAAQLLLSLKEQTQDSIKSIRRIVYDLRPPALDDLGLIPAIQAHVDQQTRAAQTPQVQIDLPGDGLPQLPAAVEVALYRITLEALTNVLHHAQAQNCQIRFSILSNPAALVSLEIVDDGAGLPEHLNAGVGLASMRERASELGGEFSIEPSHPSGTKVQAVLPLVIEAA